MSKRTARTAMPGYAEMMAPWMMMTEMWRFHYEASAAAAEVILRRTLLAATGALSLQEAVDMVLEKPAAFSSALEEMALALAGGAAPQEAMRAAAVPVTRRMQANARRLRR
ncbi:hypothetical protein P2H44_20925 [Albimonas sp. CAU 1670]|uniref:hypothetical protein n=1 Tax=Albimonas sp. CAU 1670 TaxID=3032599 RepID=UPI0023DBF0EE|nr:hypothetical protein [Albimonas sp. CAU 1670]MDF2235032.1 hypothetical protein [Albimonas sp. CAU 1670]